MSATCHEMVVEFHKTYGHPVNLHITDKNFVNIELLQLRLNLVNEEMHEVFEALDALLRGEETSVVNLAKELADLEYVVRGAAICFGIDLDGRYMPGETVAHTKENAERTLSHLAAALLHRNEDRVAHALVSFMKWINGVAFWWNVPSVPVFKEVHRSNMSKLGEDGKPVLREDGKVLKGPHYTQPDIQSILDEQKVVA